MDECLGINGPFIEQVASDDHKIDGSMCCLGHDIPEGTAKIVKTLTHTVLLIAQVCICYMDKRSSHASLQSSITASARGLSSRHESRRQTESKPQCYRPTRRGGGFLPPSHNSKQRG